MAVAFALAYGTTLAVPGVSVAAKSDCTSPNFCIWQNIQYGGWRSAWGWDQAGAWVNRGTATAGSLWNNRTAYVTWIASGSNGGGSTACLPVGYPNSELDIYVYPSLAAFIYNNIRSVDLSTWRTTCPSGTTPVVV
jgi:hypothetical protein